MREPINLVGLTKQFPKDKFKQSLKLILSENPPKDEDLADEQFLDQNQDASELYGLIHARYIQSPTGMAQVFQKFLKGVYGYCPRTLCDK